MIFFSYSQNDKNIVHPCIDKLEKKKKFKYFFDEKDNEYGDKYWENINKSLNDSNVFVFFNSKNYIKSGSCLREYLQALKLESEGRIMILEIQIEESGIFKTSPDKIYLKINDDEFDNKFFKSIDKNSKIIKTNKKYLNAIKNTRNILMIYLDNLKNNDKKFLKKFFIYATNNYKMKNSIIEKYLGFNDQNWNKKINDIFNEWLKKHLVLLINIDKINKDHKNIILNWTNSTTKYDFIYFLSENKYYKKAKKYFI